MTTKLVRIGNSRGIRLNANTLKQCGFENEVLINVIDNLGILIQPKKNVPRKDWEEKFKEMHSESDDMLLIDDFLEIDGIWEW